MRTSKTLPQEKKIAGGHVLGNVQLPETTFSPLLYKDFWGFTRRRYLVRNQSFGTACVPHHQGLKVMIRDPPDHIETLMMGHTGSPKTLVPDQVTTLGKNPKTSIQ
jgi:hypothetical protein